MTHEIPTTTQLLARLKERVEKKRIIPYFTKLSPQGTGYNSAVNDVLSLIEEVEKELNP